MKRLARILPALLLSALMLPAMLLTAMLLTAQPTELPAALTSAAPTSAAPPSAAPRAAAVLAGRPLVFPRDHGSHADFRTEWWYVTGWLQAAGGETLGFQVTFFRTRADTDDRNPSAFAPRQLIIAHAAISDPARGRLWKDQRIARAGLGLVGASERNTDVRLDRWSLVRNPGGTDYRATIAADDFALTLTLTPTQPPMLNGRAGFSQKGPAALSASYYYSLPQLRVAGSVTRATRAVAVTGQAWLDHEWSSEYLDAQATGWDWIGINLDDGGALMAFRIRNARGETHWAGGSLRRPDGSQQVFAPAEIAFEPGRRWRSPRTGFEYPIEWRVRAGDLSLSLQPLLDDQESDSRLSTGAVYWEGAVTALRSGKRLGRGYLELTGYGARLRLP